MKIKKILGQIRRDFTAVYECEHCDHEHTGSGYDDAHFHNTIVPDMVCEKCGEKAPADFRALAPKYAEELLV